MLQEIGLGDVQRMQRRTGPSGFDQRTSRGGPEQPAEAGDPLRRVPLGRAHDVSQDAALPVEQEQDERSQHGLARTLIANMVEGVTKGFERRLDLVGVGYRAQLLGPNLSLALGYSHPIVFPVPAGIKIEVKDGSVYGKS